MRPQAGELGGVAGTPPDVDSFILLSEVDEFILFEVSEGPRFRPHAGEFGGVAGSFKLSAEEECCVKALDAGSVADRAWGVPGGAAQND